MFWLISFEGIDGSGKTTLIKNLKQKTIDFNLKTHGWRETELGKKL
jgi:thymidylate kinase